MIFLLYINNEEEEGEYYDKLFTLELTYYNSMHIIHKVLQVAQAELTHALNLQVLSWILSTKKKRHIITLIHRQKWQ